WKYRASTQTSTQINGQSHAGHKDLAAIPLDKAILDIGRPNLTIYKPHFTFPHGTRGTAQKPGAHCHSNLHPPTISITLEVWAESWSPGTISQILAPRTSLYHFHHPKTTCPDSNTYKKLLIYKQREFMGGSPQSKPFIEELITESPKSPVSQPPDSNQMAKIETDYWSASHDSSLEADEEKEEEGDGDSGEEMALKEVSERETQENQSLLDWTPFHTSLHHGQSNCSLSAYGRTTLSLLYFSDFSPWGVRMEAHTLLICPYEMLVVTSKGQTKLPPGLTGICQPRTSQ
ncbi:hypothetical protein E2I00_006681, partial [Balaenoptera physalus]